MDKLSLLTSTPDTSKIVVLWIRKPEIYTDTQEATEKEKFNILVILLDITLYEYVDSTNDNRKPMDKLEKVYDKKIIKIYPRWKLAIEKQIENESMESYA